MNLILLEPHEISEGAVTLNGRRFEHIRKVHRAACGSELRVGVINGKLGTGRIEDIGSESLTMSISMESDPPPPLPVRLILALPRPKVLNRTIAAAVSMGIRKIDLINAWRVEKSYWLSPRTSQQNLRLQAILGLEQGGDTILPVIRMHRLFVPFVREELAHELVGWLTLLADPKGDSQFPQNTTSPVVLAIGPEGGFIQREIDSFREIGFHHVSVG